MGEAVEGEMSMNPFCEIAVEEALCLREAGSAAEVVTATVGPAQSVDTLRTALAMGSDRAVHVHHDPDPARLLLPSPAPRSSAPLRSRRSPASSSSASRWIADFRPNLAGRGKEAAAGRVIEGEAPSPQPPPPPPPAQSYDLIVISFNSIIPFLAEVCGSFLGHTPRSPATFSTASPSRFAATGHQGSLIVILSIIARK